MIKILTGNQIKNIDKKAIEDLNIPGMLLMENAGRAVYDQIIKVLEEIKIEDPNILVICGKGNNGGDGFVAARYLAQNGLKTNVISIYEEEDLTGAALLNHNILKHFLDITYLDEINMDILQDMISTSIIIIDAIFGTGLSSEIKGKLYEVIDSINSYAENYVVSVDIPSGIDANTGKILGISVIADYTVTFYAPKLGLIMYPGTESAGEIVADKISIPDFLLDEPDYNINLITQEYVSNSLPIRPENSHKGIFGSVFNVAGSLGLTGAAFMSSYSSLKVGAGYSILATPESLVPILSTMTPELIYISLKETPEQTISKEALTEALDKSQDANSFLIGPGIGTNPSTVDFVLRFTQKLTDRGLSVIFDADALNCFAKAIEFGNTPVLPINSIITPHPKELSRLIGISIEDILSDRISSARMAAQKFNTIVVLKGARTIIAEPNGNIYINPTGNSALATAGSGDILSGMIAGFVAQGVNMKDAAVLGVYLHGRSGELASEEMTEYSVSAANLLEYIPEALKELE